MALRFIFLLVAVSFVLILFFLQLLGKNTNYSVWIIIAFNYHLPPKERTRSENLIIVGVIPGPKVKNVQIFTNYIASSFKQMEPGMFPIPVMFFRTHFFRF